MRAAAWALAVSTCGGAAIVPRAQPDHRVDVMPPPPTTDAGFDVAPENRLDTLAAKHDRIAPRTREIVREEIDLEHQHERSLTPFDVDTCLRVTFDADAPAVVALVTNTVTLAETRGSSGSLGAAGPVCIHAHDAPTLKLNGQGRLGFVVWASP